MKSGGGICQQSMSNEALRHSFCEPYLINFYYYHHFLTYLTKIYLLQRIIVTIRFWVFSFPWEFSRLFLAAFIRWGKSYMKNVFCAENMDHKMLSLLRSVQINQLSHLPFRELVSWCIFGLTIRESPWKSIVFLRHVSKFKHGLKFKVTSQISLRRWQALEM